MEIYVSDANISNLLKQQYVKMMTNNTRGFLGTLFSVFWSKNSATKTVNAALLRHRSDYQGNNKRKMASVCDHLNDFFYIWGIDIFICPIAEHLRAFVCIIKRKFLVFSHIQTKGIGDFPVLLKSRGHIHIFYPVPSKKSDDQLSK